ncbi:MAG: YedE-related selenium metabolism membrane protein [Planctomycetes bacterium]|nr:YedE-related selenium metabolism membrane protein [Planctomycetota bacterium]
MRERLIFFFASRPGIILVGGVIGLLAVLLEFLGNPPNMGVCVACFERDLAGALGLHRAAAAQYLRPEIPGFVLGALVAAFLFREFRPRGGAAPIVRFLLGAFAMIGVLVFLGCPWRLLHRLAGGDLNGIVGAAGLAAGIGLGVWFLRRGYFLGRARPGPAAMGWVLPGLMIGALVLLAARPSFLLASTTGPGAMHAPVLASLGAGLLIGFVAQRARFCTIGAFKNLFLAKNPHLLFGVLAFLVVAFAFHLIIGTVDFGFALQPMAHSSHLWNFLGMALAGLAFTLAGGCPGRQLFLAGEGDADAGVFVLGAVTGAGLAHNFGIVAAPDSMAGGVLQVGGPGASGQVAVALGLCFCALLGILMRKSDSRD